MRHECTRTKWLTNGVGTLVGYVENYRLYSHVSTPFYRLLAHGKTPFMSQTCL